MSGIECDCCGGKEGVVSFAGELNICDDCMEIIDTAASKSYVFVRFLIDHYRLQDTISDTNTGNEPNKYYVYFRNRKIAKIKPFSELKKYLEENNPYPEDIFCKQVGKAARHGYKVCIDNMIKFFEEGDDEE